MCFIFKQLKKIYEKNINLKKNNGYLIDNEIYFGYFI